MLCRLFEERATSCDRLGGSCMMVRQGQQGQWAPPARGSWFSPMKTASSKANAVEKDRRGWGLFFFVPQLGEHACGRQ